MAVDSVNDARTKKIYRSKVKQQQKDYQRNLKNLKTQQEINNTKRIKQNRQGIQDIERNANERVDVAKGRMDEKVENMRDYYRGKTYTQGEDFHNENQRIKSEYAKRLEILSDRYHRSIKSQVDHDTNLRKNIKNSYKNHLSITRTENNRRIEDLQEGFRRSMDREQQQNIDSQTRLKRQTSKEIERLNSGFNKTNEDFRRVTSNLKGNFDRNISSLNRRQILFNRRRADENKKYIGHIRRQSDEKLSQAIRYGKDSQIRQREFYRSKHFKELETMRKSNQEIRDKNAKNIDQIKFSYNQNLKETGLRNDLTRADMQNRFDQRIRETNTKYSSTVNKLGESYQKSIKSSNEASRVERARLQRSYEVKLSQMNEANQLQRNSFYNRALVEFKKIEENYNNRLEQIKGTAKTREERQSKVYKQKISEIEIQRQQDIKLVTKRLDKRMEMAQSWHKKEMKTQEKAFMKERLAMRKKMGADYTQLKESYDQNLKNQKINSEMRITSIQENSTLMRERDYNSMEVTKLRLMELADERYQKVQARHLKQLREVETARTRDIKEILNRIDGQNRGLQRNMEKKIDAMQSAHDQRITTLSNKNSKIKADYNNELDNLIDNQNKKIGRLNEENKTAQNHLRQEQQNQLDELSKSHQDQLAQRGRKMDQLKNRYEGRSGRVARMQAQNDRKLKRMKNSHFEDKKAMQDYYDQKITDSRDSLKNERVNLQKDYALKSKRDQEDYTRMQNHADILVEKKATEFEVNTTRLNREHDKQITNLEQRNKKILKSSRLHYEGNIQDLNKTNSENLKAQKTAYDLELKDSLDSSSKNYHENLERINANNQMRMEKTVEGYEQKLSSQRGVKGRSIRQKEFALKILQQQHADELELQRENNLENKKITAQENKANLKQLRKEMEADKSLGNVKGQSQINNMESDHTFEVASLKLKHEKEMRHLNKKYKLSLKNDRDNFRKELKNISSNSDASQKRMEVRYQTKVDKIQTEYRKRLKENDLA